MPPRPPWIRHCMLFSSRLLNFVQIGAPTPEIWRHIHFSRWRPRPINTTSGFVFVDVTAFTGHSLSANQISSTYLHSRLRKKQLLFLKNKRPPYRNSTSGFDLDHFAIIYMLFCIWLPIFVQIGAPTADIWRHIHFSRWRPRPLNTASGFVFVDVTAFRRSKSISIPNFVEISPFSAEI